MESTAEARPTFQHKLKNVPQQMIQGHVLPSLTRHTILGVNIVDLFISKIVLCLFVYIYGMLIALESAAMTLSTRDLHVAN